MNVLPTSFQFTLSMQRLLHIFKNPVVVHVIFFQSGQLNNILIWWASHRIAIESYSLDSVDARSFKHKKLYLWHLLR